MVLACALACLHECSYCQLAKQTTLNPSTASTLLGWQLILICLSTFPPGPMLRDPFMAHCSESSRNHPDNDVKM